MCDLFPSPFTRSSEFPMCFSSSRSTTMPSTLHPPPPVSCSTRKILRQNLFQNKRGTPILPKIILLNQLLKIACLNKNSTQLDEECLIEMLWQVLRKNIN